MVSVVLVEVLTDIIGDQDIQVGLVFSGSCFRVCPSFRSADRVALMLQGVVWSLPTCRETRGFPPTVDGRKWVNGK